MKAPRINKAIVKRVQRAQYDQPRHGKCIICGGNWDDCPHSRLQVDHVVQAVRMVEMLGLEVPA